jgi:retron-type reverse transcriptase
MDELLSKVPHWVLRPLPINAELDASLHKSIDAQARKLPGSLPELHRTLMKVRRFREYDAAANRASAHVWQALESLYGAEPRTRSVLLIFARAHMTTQAVARICRRLVKDPQMWVRNRACKLVQQFGIREVALPISAEASWDQTGWMRGTTDVDLKRHHSGKRVLERHDLPEIATVAGLRKLLAIKSEAQLGWFLLASELDNGPYSTFTIPKRDGSKRTICAPGTQLRWVQRRILENILDKVPPHSAAHGFVTGRSTVTNATPHLGAKIILKFDLSDFFPTIHYNRVMGLFARLGYAVGNARFSRSDRSRQIAPTLARLCCYTPVPCEWGTATLPQGAPTSPAITNLVCRRLDSRLEGLAKRNKGVYTRYADDLTFSFRAEGVDPGRFRWWVDQICHQEGFFVNQKKFHVIRSSQRQVVTGIVVNDELHIPREERRRFRAILHNCRTQPGGVDAQARDHPRFQDYLRGFASYVHMVQPEEGAALLKEVEELLGPDQPEGESPS